MLKPELKFFFTVSCSLLPLLLYVTLFFNIISPEHFFSFCGTSTSRKKNKFKPDFQNFQVEAGASDFSRKKIFEFVIDHSKRCIKNITKCLTNFFSVCFVFKTKILNLFYFSSRYVQFANFYFDKFYRNFKIK